MLRLRIFALLLTAFAFSWAAQDAQAGAIRYAGSRLKKGTVAVADVAASGGQAATGGVATAGKATGGAVKTGAETVGHGAKATPGVLAHGTKAAARGIWKVIW